MAKFKYVGTDDGPMSVKAYGFEFERGGKAVEVTGDLAIGKLSKNHCFELVKSSKARVKPAVVEKIEVKPEEKSED